MKTTPLSVLALVVTVQNAVFAQEIAAPKTVADQAGAQPKSKVEHPSEFTGLTLRGGMFSNVGTGSLAAGLPTPALGLGLDFSGSMAVSQHFAVEGQVLLGFATMTGDCVKCSLMRRSLPLTFQYNVSSRKEGLYLGAGPSFFNTAKIAARPETGPLVELGTLASTLAVTGYAGYRMPIPAPDTSGHPEYRSPVRGFVDARLQVMRLNYDEVSVKGGTYLPMADAERNAHFEVMLTLAAAFAP